jgi:hypothetical protein
MPDPIQIPHQSQNLRALEAQIVAVEGLKPEVADVLHIDVEQDLGRKGRILIRIQMKICGSESA